MAKYQNRHDPPVYQTMDEDDAVSGLIFPQKDFLDNGIPVHIIRADEQELLKMAFVFKAGSSYQGKPFTTYFTRKMLSEGTEKMTAKQIAEIFDFYGASIEIASNTEFIVINILCLIGYLDKIIEVVYDILFHSVFPENELQLHKENKARDILLDGQKVKEVARHHFCTMLFGEKHPYGVFPSIDHVAAISREDICGFYERFIRPGNFSMIIAGKINKDTIKTVNRFFGRHLFNGEERLYERDFIVTADSRRQQFFPVVGAVQSALRVGNHAINRLHEDYPVLSVLNTVFGGYFGSRLMRNLREDKGYTYGVNSSLLSFPKAGYFFVSSEVKSIHTHDALHEIYYEMNRLRDEIVTDDELERVKNVMFGRFLRSIDGVYAQSELLTEMFRFGLDFSYFTHYLKQVRNVSSVQVNEIASKYFVAENMYEVIAGFKQ